MPRSAPLKIDRVASVTMKAEMPVAAISRPLASPAATPMRERERGGQQRRKSPDLHHAGESDRAEPADRADRQIHLADRDDDHLRHRDHAVDRDRQQQDLDVERRQEGGVEGAHHGAADEDDRQRAEPVGARERGAAGPSPRDPPEPGEQAAPPEVEQDRRQQQQAEPGLHPEFADRGTAAGRWSIR